MEHGNSSTLFYLSGLTTLFKVEDALKNILENLQDIPELVAIILTYYELDQKESLTYIAPELPSEEQTILSYLYSEKWYSNQIPEDTIIVLEIPTLLVTYGYIFPTTTENLEYLLIISKQELSIEKINYISRQIKIINHCLNIAQTSAQRKEKIKNLENMIQVCEHQIRHYISSIKLFAENLYLGLSQHPLQEQAEFIKQNSHDIQAYLDKKILEINRYKPQFKSENIHEIVRRSWHKIVHLYQQKNLQLQLNSEGVLVIVDSWQIEQVISNIFSNAIHFSPDNTDIICQWYLFPREVLVEILDHGQGFSDEVLEKAFTPYFTQREGGKGLGLAIAKSIMEMHKGKIWLENLPQGGAKVCLTLPRYLT